MAISKEFSIALVLFLVLTWPFILIALPIPQSFNSTNFSIYNKGWGGLSDFQDIIESEGGDGVEVKTIIGSLNILNRINSTGEDAGAIVIMGPGVHYDTTESIALMLYLLRGGRVVICDDFGTANDLLTIFNSLLSALPPIDAASVFGGLGFNEDINYDTGGGSNETTTETVPFPIVAIGFNGSLLIDTQSYDETPVQPILTPPTASYDSSGNTVYPLVDAIFPELIDNVDSIIGNYASTLSMKVRYPVDVDGEEVWETSWVPFGWFPVSIANLLASKYEEYGIDFETDVQMSVLLGFIYSSSTSYQEYNVTQASDPNKIHPDYESEWGGLPSGFPVFFSLPIGDKNAASTGSLTLCSDPSIFVNGIISDSATHGHDNRIFAINVIREILLKGRTSTTIYFDEGHLAQSILSPLIYLGTYFRWLDLLTMFPFIAPLFPLTVIGLAKKFMPKQRSAKPMLRTKVEQYYGRSFFSVKMRWFLESQEYNRGLELIYRRVRRRVIKRYTVDATLTPDLLARLVTQEYREVNYNDLVKRLRAIEVVISSRVFITEEQFLGHYLVLKNISDRIQK